jgi:CheY-like chemotaxis protein
VSSSTGIDDGSGPAATGAVRVLVVDDSAPVRDLVVVNLELEGFEVRTAVDGQEGVEAAVDWRPDLITLDVVMPRLDGFGALERLRSDPRTADVPIVVLTSKDMTEEDRRRLNGRISFLARKGSFTGAELVRLVERVAATEGVA